MAETAPDAGEVCQMVFAEAFCSNVGVNATGDADGDAVAVSGTGNASSDTVAVSGTGQAEGPIAVSVDGDADGNIVVAGTGDANSSGCAAVACAAVSGTGNATGPLPLSATGGCRGNSSQAYRPCANVSATGNATGYHAAASGTGNASGQISVSLAGCAEGFFSVDRCDTVGVQPTDDADGNLAAVSGTGNATTCGPFSSHAFLALWIPSCAAISGTGNASGVFAASAVGPADGNYAVSGTGAADGRQIGVSGTGNASGSTAVSGTGNASGSFIAVSGTGNASGSFLGASGTGNASGAIAASAAGCAEGTLSIDRCSTVVVEPTGDARCSSDWGIEGCTAISATGNATGPRAVDQETSENLASSSTRDRDHGQGPDSTGWPDADAAIIRPGIRVLGQICTGNFIFSDASNSTLYIGTAAHCVNTTHVGERVDLAKGQAWGWVAFDGFKAFESAASPPCPDPIHLDFGLIEIPEEFRDLVHPAVKAWGGPTDLRDRARSGEHLLQYGNSVLRAGVQNAQEGWALGNARCGTEAEVPGSINGDSGAPVLTSDGQALGVHVRKHGFITTTNLEPALAFAEAHMGIDLELKTWTTFRSGTLQDNGDVPTSPSTSTDEAADEPASAP